MQSSFFTVIFSKWSFISLQLKLYSSLSQSFRWFNQLNGFRCSSFMRYISRFSYSADIFCSSGSWAVDADPVVRPKELASSYCLRVSSQESISYALLIRAKRSLASGYLLISGWYLLTSSRQALRIWLTVACAGTLSTLQQQVSGFRSIREDALLKVQVLRQSCRGLILLRMNMQEDCYLGGEFPELQSVQKFRFWYIIQKSVTFPNFCLALFLCNISRLLTHSVFFFDHCLINYLFILILSEDPFYFKNYTRYHGKEGQGSETPGNQIVTPQGQGRDAHHQRAPVSTLKIKLIPNGNINITHYFTEGEPNTKIYSIKFDWQDKYIAAACENGEVRVYNVKNKKLAYTMNSTKPNVPFTYVRWRPDNANFKTHNIFTTVNADGEIQTWHLTSGKCLSTMKDDSKSVDKQLYCVDYNSDGSKLAVCGSEPIIRVYDEYKRVKDLDLGGEEYFPFQGHTMRIYCVKFNKDPENPHILYSGGWDQNLITWDLRVKKPVNNIFGPLICGDGIDNVGMDILTASWKQTDQLQQWQARKGELNETLDWDGLKVSSQPCFLYAGQFSKKNNDIILAGGSNANQVKLFDKSNNNKPFCCIYDLPREIDTVDFSHDDKLFAISGADGYVRVFKINEIS